MGFSQESTIHGTENFQKRKPRWSAGFSAFTPSFLQRSHKSADGLHDGKSES